jgi:hypothetical protein
LSFLLSHMFSASMTYFKHVYQLVSIKVSDQFFRTTHNLVLVYEIL